MGNKEYITDSDADVNEFAKNLDGEVYEDALKEELEEVVKNGGAKVALTEADVKAFEVGLDTQVPEDVPSGNAGSSENDLPLTLEEMDDAKKRTSPTDPFGRPIQVNDPWGNAEGRQLK